MHALRLLSACIATIALAGCAAFGKNPLRDPKVTKCYVADSTAHISHAAFDSLFRVVGAAGPRAFPSCDSDTAVGVRIRPTASGIAEMKASYIALGINLATFGTGAVLASVYEAPLFLLLGGLRAEPQAQLFYEAEYTDSKGKPRKEHILIEADGWFKEKERSREELLQLSERKLGALVQGIKLSDENPYHHRISMDIPPFAWYTETVAMAVHYETFYPYNLGLEISGAGQLSTTDRYRAFQVHAGWQRYFLGAHRRLYLGLHALAGGEYLDHGHAWVGLPIIFGYVWQGKRIVTRLGFGVGPGYVFAPSGDEFAGYRAIGFGHWSTGFAF